MSGTSNTALVMVCRLLAAVASLLAERRLYVSASGVAAGGISSCAAQASLLHGMWDLPRPGIEAVSHTLETLSLNHWAVSHFLVTRGYPHHSSSPASLL